MTLVDMGMLDEEELKYMIVDKDTGDVYDMRDEEDMELLLADAYANSQLFTELKLEEEYDSPEEAIFSMTEFSGLGYDAEQAFRASWLRALRNNDNPYKRASLLATMTYDALDSDLLPTREVN